MYYIVTGLGFGIAVGIIIVGLAIATQLDEGKSLREIIYGTPRNK